MKSYLFLILIGVVSVGLIAYGVNLIVSDIQKTALKKEVRELEAHRKEIFSRTENLKF